jgi:hypothetical protein
LARTAAGDGFAAIGRSARALAETRFGIDRITDEFEAVLTAAAAR